MFLAFHIVDIMGIYYPQYWLQGDAKKNFNSHLEFDQITLSHRMMFGTYHNFKSKNIIGNIQDFSIHFICEWSRYAIHHIQDYHEIQCCH